MRCNNLISCCDITTKFTDTKTQLHLLHSSSFKRYNWAPACGLINSFMDLFILFIITETNSPLVSQLLRQRHGGGPSVSAAGGTWTVCAERRSASHRRSVSGRSQSHTAGCTHTHTLTHRLWNCLCGNSNRKRKLPPPKKKTKTERRCVQVTVPEWGVAWTGCRWRTGEGRCDVQTAAAGRGAHL